MPGRVTTFLRNPSGNIAHIKKAAANRSRHSSPDVSDGEDSDGHHRHPHLHAVKMSEVADALMNHRRLSLPFVKKETQCTAVALSWNIESPPIVFHGSPNDSSGALLSGTMALDVKEDLVELESFNASLNIHVHHKRPFQTHCAECANQYTELQTWKFLAGPTTLNKGRHLFPFSALLDGHLPVTMSSSLMSVSYEFKADAILSPNSLPVGAPNVTKFEHILPVKRSLPEPDVPHHSVRLFPPTNIKSSVHFNTVIHPTGTNKVTLKLDGLMSLNERTRTLDIWKLKKLTWKLEETTKTIAPACNRHSPSAQQITIAAEDNGTSEEAPEPVVKKGAQRNEVRLLGDKHIHEGWKSDYSGNDGTVDFEFEYGVTHRTGGRKDQLKYAANSKTRDGTETTHSLLIELVVSKEFAPEGRPQQAAQTGTGRILRMHFNVVLTEHSGLGVSWDEEAPPTYQDVPPSPPEYAFPLEPPLIEYENLEIVDARRISGEPPSRRPSGSH